MKNGNGNHNGYDHKFRVRAGVPLPTRAVYPFGRMEVGDSFTIPKEISESCVRVAAANFAKRAGGKMKFSVLRAAADRYGCWRIK